MTTIRTTTADSSDTLRARVEACQAAHAAAIERLQAAQQRSGAIFLDGSPDEKQAHRALLRELEREREEHEAVRPLLEARLAAAVAREEDAVFAAHGARYRTLAADTRKQLVAYDTAAAQLYRVLVKLEALYQEGHDIEREFRNANREAELPATELVPGRSMRAEALFLSRTFSLFPRGIPSETLGEFHDLRQYRDAKA